MKRIPPWVVIVVLIVVIFATKFIFFADKNAKAPPAKGPAVLGVNYYVVTPQPLKEQIFVAGKTGAMNAVDLVPEIGGKVTNIYFSEGDAVKKGDLLVKLNDADFQAQLTKVRSQMKLSSQKLDRVKKLLDVNGVSHEEYEMQENELEALKADAAYIEAQIRKTSIVAPFSGRIGLKNVSEGAFVTTAMPIVSLVQLKPLYIEFAVPEKYASLLSRDMQVQFSPDNGGDTTFAAKIYAIEPRVEETTKTVKVRALYNGPRDFYPGSFVKVFMVFGESKNALLVPTPAVIPTLKGQKVFLAKHGEAVEVPVQIGLRTDKNIQVTDGIVAGDTVITTGLLSVKKGSKIRLLKGGK